MGSKEDRRSLRGSSRSQTIGAIAAMIFAGWCAIAPPVRGAETVILRYGDARENLPLADLETLVETGDIPPNLEKVSQILSPTQRAQILAALRAELDIEPAKISAFLNTEMGGRLLRAIAALTPREDALQLFYLRRALMRSARQPGGFSVLDFIEAYPQETLELNLDQAFLVAGSFNQAFWQTQRFMLEIAPQLAPNRPPLDIPFDPAQPGPDRARTFNLSMNDRTRDRQIPVKIYLPRTASERKPLILFSHGLFSVQQEMRYLAEHLASHGYVVVIPEHPGSNETHLRQALGNEDGPLLDPEALLDPATLARIPELLFQGKLLAPEEFLNRPRDLSFVLDELSRLNQNSRRWRGKLATDNVLVLGYSLGGGTALSLAGAELQLEGLKTWCGDRNIFVSSLGVEAQCAAKGLPENRYQLRDPRVKAAIALSPTTSLLFGDTGLSLLDVPTLIASGSADKTTPALNEQVVAFTKMPDPKWLAAIIGGTHLSFKDPITTMDQAGQPDTLYSGGEVVGDRAFEVRNYTKAIALAMTAQLTDEADTYEIFLTPDYAERVSNPRFVFRLVREIPPEIQETIQEFVQDIPE